MTTSGGPGVDRDDHWRTVVEWRGHARASVDRDDPWRTVMERDGLRRTVIEWDGRGRKARKATRGIECP
jgi:hypothetical protein